MGAAMRVALRRNGVCAQDPICDTLCDDPDGSRLPAPPQLGPQYQQGWARVNRGDYPTFGNESTVVYDTGADVQGLPPRPASPMSPHGHHMGGTQARYMGAGAGNGTGTGCAGPAAVVLGAIALLLVVSTVFVNRYLPTASPGVLLDYVSAAVGRYAHREVAEEVLDDGTVPLPRELVARPFYENRSMRECAFERNADTGLFAGEPMWMEYIALHRAARGRMEAGHPEYGKILIFKCQDGSACNGLGSEVKGIATALYVAMMTKRALFLQWQRHGENMNDLFGQPVVDWSVPPSFQVEGRCSESGIDTDNIEKVMGSSDPCFRVYSSLAPTFIFPMLKKEDTGSWLDDSAKAVLESIESRIWPVYHVGCAANFLFSYEGAYHQLLKTTRLKLSREKEKLPHKFVSVHLRFGDQMFNASDDSHPSARIVMRAIQCAVELGQKELGAGPDWAIMFASDSVDARTLALQHGAMQAGLPLIFESRWDPVHLDMRTNMFGLEQDSDERLWGSLADHLLLKRSRGLVQCFSRNPQCGRVHDLVHSGFSLVAAQEGLMPVDKYRVVKSVDSCEQEDLPTI